MAIVEGPVTDRTKANLVRGIRGKPIPAAAVDAVVVQATALLEKAVARYEQDVAIGEVGDGGSGVASTAPPAADRGPTGLLYGRVQSGKTAGMTLASALAFDNGFRIVVVVTANNLALVRQTANRLKALSGPRVFSTIKDGAEYEWVGQELDLRADLARDGLVIVCAKDRTHLPAVIRFLQEIDAASVPALIFDDEADAATPDTTLAARTAGYASAPAFESTIHRNVIENTAPGEQGESLRETLPHHAFVQVTATPYVLFLQRADAPIRPAFVHMLEPGPGYCGGREFFENYDPTRQPAAPPIVTLPPNEGQLLVAARSGVPQGLADSCSFFVLAAAAHSLTRAAFPEGGYKHLSHTSPRIDQHTRVANLITRQLRALRDQLRDPASAATLQAFQGAYAQLRGTLPGAPPLAQLLAAAAGSIAQAEVVRVNSESDEPIYGPAFNFVVGGNILSRGLTIEDLLVTYYVREARTAQMDTVWQHARMYGYRDELMPYSRVFLPAHLATLFRQIHASEEELRGVLLDADADALGAIPILTPAHARPTRPGAVEAGALQIYRGTVQQITPYYLVTEPAIVGQSAVQIAAVLQQNGVVFGAGEARQDRFTEVPLDVLRGLVEILPIRENDDGRWSTSGVLALLRATEERYGATGVVYARALDPGDDPQRRRVHGVLSGPEVAMGRATGRFVLALTYVGNAATPTAWYPTLLVPPDLPTHVFNPF